MSRTRARELRSNPMHAPRFDADAMRSQFTAEWAWRSAMRLSRNYSRVTVTEEKQRVTIEAQ